MRNFKTLLAIGMMAAGSINVSAQGCSAEGAEQGCCGGSSYGFVQVQAGGATTFTSGKNFMGLVTPTFSLAVGKMFTPVVGARLHFNGYEQKGLIGSIDKNYKYKQLNSNFDVMLNLSNLISKKCCNPFNVYLIGGIGLNYAWDNDEFTTLTSTYGSQITENVSNAWGNGTARKSLLDHSIRAGFLLDYNIARNFSVGAEFDINNVSDRFNSKYNDADDWMMTAQVSVTYKFGFKKEKKVEQPAPVVAPEPVKEVVAPAPKPEPVKEVVAPAPKPEPKPQPVVKEEPLNETAYFQIRESDPNGDAILDKVVAWCNKYPSKKITISGYADKGTGNAKINMKYSQQRANRVAKALQSKGISADRMTVNAYGDTVQPYTNNDDNRCTIVVGK